MNEEELSLERNLHSQEEIYHVIDYNNFGEDPLSSPSIKCEERFAFEEEKELFGLQFFP